MADYTQTFIDDLITTINTAEAPESITNEMVASVMDFLNIKCKGLDNSNQSLATDQQDLRNNFTQALTMLVQHAATISKNKTAVEQAQAAADSVQSELANFRNAVNAILHGDATAAIDSLDEVITFLQDITDDTTLAAKLLKLRKAVDNGDATNGSRIAAVNADLQQHKDDTAQAMQTVLTEIYGAMETLQTSDTNMATQIADLQTADTNLGNRITALGDKVDNGDATNGSRIAAVNADLQQHKDDIAQAIQTVLTEIYGAMETLQTSDTNMATQIADLQTADTNLGNRITALGDKVDNLPTSTGASLGPDGKVPDGELPSYLLRAVEFAQIETIPATKTPTGTTTDTINRGQEVVFDTTTGRFYQRLLRLSLLGGGTATYDYWADWPNRSLYASHDGTPYADRVYIDTSTGLSYRYRNGALQKFGAAKALQQHQEASAEADIAATCLLECWRKNDYNPNGLASKMPQRYKTALVWAPWLDTSAATTLMAMFYGCSSLASVPQLDTSAATTFENMFGGCTSLTTLGGDLDVSQATSMGMMFSNCPLLTTATLRGLGTQPHVNIAWQTFGNMFPWGTGSDTARQSLVDSLLTHSFDRASAGYEALTIQLGAATKAVLTDAEKAQIAAKGFTIA